MQWLPLKRGEGLNGRLARMIPKKPLGSRNVRLDYLTYAYSQGKLSLFYSINKISDFMPCE